MLGAGVADAVQMSTADSVLLDLPARLESLSVLEGCVTALLSQEPDLSDRDAQTFEVALAVHETCLNIIEHAYGGQPGRVQVAFTFLDDPRRLEIEVHDTGESFDLADIQPPNLDEAHTGGYGLFLIQRLMDEVVYTPEPGNNRWRLVKGLN
jgi:serine/threonine-protein kinase RsbW